MNIDSAEPEYDEEGKEMLPYSHDKPMFTCGQIARGDAQYSDQPRVRCDGDVLWSHYTHLSDAATMNDASNVIDLVVMLVASTEAPPPPDTPHLIINGGEEFIPKNYLECLVLPDWRDWVMAVNKEMEGWNDNQAYEEIDVNDILAEENICSVRELYSYKRSGKAKHRCIVYGKRSECRRHLNPQRSTATIQQLFRSWL